MQQKIFLLLFLSLSNCAHGPNINLCVSGMTSFDCSKTNPIDQKQSDGYAAYSSESAQALFSYCALHEEIGTPPPRFYSCSSDYASGGFKCKYEDCSLNFHQNGAICMSAGDKFIPYENSNNYVVLSQSDNATLLSYCNVSLF